MASDRPVLKITCDVGGTFTDVVLSDQFGQLAVGKAPTSPSHLLSGLLSALADGAARLDLTTEDALAACEIFVYSTTQATNAILEGKTERTALFVTQGFPDVLVRREGGSMHPYDFSRPYPEPYIARSLTFEIPERVGSNGAVLTALDEVEASKTIDRMPGLGVEAVAVCLMWATAHPAHEERIGQLLSERLPGVPFTLSHSLNPILREYRRASGTAIDASLKRGMQRHLTDVAEGLRAGGFEGELLAATSAGGALPMAELIERPIYAAKSGPSLAPVAGQLYSDEFGDPDVVVCDTGGTSFDISLIRDGSLVTTRETWLGEQFTGHLTGLSSVDVRSIGAGGGSIAWLDPGGLLRVGPESAGASPGPACYGNGGQRPTVTDAALLLGYLDPNQFLGGRLRLDVVAAERAMDSLAGPLTHDRLAVAEAIMTIANEHMVDAIKTITVNQGIDPRNCLIVAGGGAAGMGIASIAVELGCSRIVLPQTAGALSAFGGQYADFVSEENRSCHTYTDDFDFKTTNQAVKEIMTALDPLSTSLRSHGAETQRIDWFVEARYLHQAWTLEVPCALDTIGDAHDVDTLAAAFHSNHERVFAVSEPGANVEIMQVAGRLVVSPAKPPRRNGRERQAEPRPLTEKRRAFFSSYGEIDVACLDGEMLSSGDSFDGPAIVLEPTTTIVVPPSWRLEVTECGDYMLERM